MQFGPDKWDPFISHPDVHLLPIGKKVICVFWDSKRKKWRFKSDVVKFEPHMNEVEKQEMVSVAADALKRFRDDHHNLEDNMPHRPSAESAHVGGRNRRRRLA